MGIDRPSQVAHTRHLSGYTTYYCAAQAKVPVSVWLSYEKGVLLPPLTPDQRQRCERFLQTLERGLALRTGDPDLRTR